MNPFSKHRKKTIQFMRPYITGEDISKVSVTEGVIPKDGDWVAIAADDPTDQWLITSEFYAANYEPVV